VTDIPQFRSVAAWGGLLQVPLRDVPTMERGSCFLIAVHASFARTFSGVSVKYLVLRLLGLAM
jgi:hypothetical protein